MREVDRSSQEPAARAFEVDGHTPSVIGVVAVLALYEPPLTRGEINELSGCSLPAVTKAINYLASEELVEPVYLRPQGFTGRPPQGIRPSPTMAARIKAEPLWSEAIEKRRTDTEIAKIADELHVTPQEALAHIISFYQEHAAEVVSKVEKPLSGPEKFFASFASQIAPDPSAG